MPSLVPSPDISQSQVKIQDGHSGHAGIPRAVPTHGEQTRSQADGSGADEATEGRVRRQHANDQDA